MVAVPPLRIRPLEPYCVPCLRILMLWSSCPKLWIENVIVPCCTFSRLSVTLHSRSDTPTAPPPAPPLQAGETSTNRTAQRPVSRDPSSPLVSTRAPAVTIPRSADSPVCSPGVGKNRSMTLLLRVILVVVLSAIVLAIAYVVVTDPGSGTDVTARGHRSPVQAHVGPAVRLGHGRAVMASGPAGLWVARQPPTGSPGEVERIDTATGRPGHTYQVNILPEGIAVGHGVIWVLGTRPNDNMATL